MRVRILLLTTVLSGLSGCTVDGTPPRREEPVAGAAAESYAVGDRPTAIVIGDFNGDRVDDAAVSIFNDASVTMLLGNSGRFRSGGFFPAGHQPADIEAGDVDHDGDLDLIVANHDTSAFTVLVNDGKARFSPAPGSPFETGARPHIHSVIASDLDGDGWLDVAVESTDSNEVRIRRGGREGFGPVIAVAAGTNPYFQLGAADVTGEGIDDILIPGHGDRTVRVITWDGSAFVLTPIRIATGATPWVVVGGDIDGDTKIDLAVVETDAVSGWLNRSGTFMRVPWSPASVPGATALVMGDIDGDQREDLVVGPWDGDQIFVIRSNKTAPERLTACTRPTGLAISDLDRDGAVEIVVACPTEGRVIVVKPGP